MKKANFLGTVCAMALSVTGASTAAAQDAAGPAGQGGAGQGVSEQGGIQDIIVTAQRRAQNLQNVPISVNAFSTEMVETRRITDVQSLSTSVPSFSINSLSKSRLNPSLRGGSSSLSSAGAEQAVGLFIDDQYFGGPGDFEIDLFDVERIEVMRGPQGTLFGRNTTGGNINVVTRKPSDKMEGKFEATIGNYNTLEGRGYVSGPLGERLFGSFAFTSRDRDGTTFNMTTGHHMDDVNRASFRGKLLWEATDNLEITAALGYSRAKETEVPRDTIFTDVPITNQDLIDLGFVADDDPRVVSNDVDGQYKSRQWTGNLRAEYSAPNATIYSITTYRDFKSADEDLSLTGAPVPIYDFGESRPTKSFSQELRYASKYDGAFNWVGGLYYFYSKEKRLLTTRNQFDENTYAGFVQSANYCPLQTGEDSENGVVTPACVTNFPQLFGLTNSFATETNRTTSYSAYADGNFDMFEGFTLLGGLRYTRDKKKFNGAVGGGANFFWNPPVSADIDPATGIPFTGQIIAGSKSWGKLTYRLGFQYKPTEHVMIYGTRSTGFRSGVFSAIDPAPGTQNIPVDPETALSHEIGVKSRFLDNRIQLNIAAFNVEYKNLQFFYTSPTGGITNNAGKARVRGVEVELMASVNDYLTLSANYSHQSGTSSGIPADVGIAAGTPPQGTIPNTYMAAADFDYPFANGNSFTAHVDFTHKDAYGLEFNDAPQFVSKTKALVNASLSYKLASGFEFSIWGQNLTNENIKIYGNDFWFVYYDLATATANPEVVTGTSQPRFAPPRTYGATLRYSF